MYSKTDLGKAFYLDDFAESLELPDFDSVRENNEMYLDGFYLPAYDVALEKGQSEADAEEAGMEAERVGSDELYSQWEGAVESAARTLLEESGLDLVRVTQGTFKLVPEKSWRDAAGKILDTINGVGYFYFSSTQEFLDSGPYTPKEAVISHLHYITSRPEVYGTASAQQLYEQAF